MVEFIILGVLGVLAVLCLNWGSHHAAEAMEKIQRAAFELQILQERWGEAEQKMLEVQRHAKLSTAFNNAGYVLIVILTVFVMMFGGDSL